MFFKILFVLTALALSTNAQTTPPAPSSSGLTSCIVGCFIPAYIQNGCTGPEDLRCLCSRQMSVDFKACMEKHCSPDEITNAQKAFQMACSTITPTETVTPTPRPVSFTSVGASDMSYILSVAATYSPTPSKAAGISLQAGAGAVLGAILAGVLAF